MLSIVVGAFKLDAIALVYCEFKIQCVKTASRIQPIVPENATVAITGQSHENLSPNSNSEIIIVATQLLTVLLALNLVKVARVELLWPQLNLVLVSGVNTGRLMAMVSSGGSCNVNVSKCVPRRFSRADLSGSDSPS